MKKRLFVVPLLVLALGGLVAGGVAFAQEGDAEDGANTTEGPSFSDRVAGILSLDEAQVESAFQQAAAEAADEAVKSRLDALVEAGTLTQVEADEIYQWYEARTEALSKIGPMGGPIIGLGGFMGRGHRHHGGFEFGHYGYGIKPAPESGETPTPTPTTSTTSF